MEKSGHPVNAGVSCFFSLGNYILVDGASSARAINSNREESPMGILDFLSKKDAKAPAPKGSTPTSAAPADALRAEVTKHGLDCSGVQIAVDGSTVTLTGKAATNDEAEKIALACGNTQGVTKVVNHINDASVSASATPSTSAAVSSAATGAAASPTGSTFYTVKSGG